MVRLAGRAGVLMALVLGGSLAAGSCSLDRNGSLSPIAGEGGASAGGASPGGSSQGGGGSSEGGGGEGGVEVGGAGGEGGAEPCGNGAIDPPEQCDDDNAIDGDGCSASCAYDAADACPPGTAIALGCMPLVLAGTLSGASDDEDCDCGSACTAGTGPDVSYAVEVLQSGPLVASLKGDFDKAVYVQSSCDSGELSCPRSSTNNVTARVASALPGTTYHIFVDADDAGGDYELTLSAGCCLDGMLTPSEECDDNNSNVGDGCDAGCVVECPSGDKHPQTHHCYLLLEAAPLTWQNARAACVALGSGWDLAAVTTLDERDYLDDTVGPSGDVWIGGNDILLEGTFVWSNGELWTWLDGQPPWGTNEPSNSGGNEHCVELDEKSGTGNDELNDDNCDVAQGYLCELEPAG